jgi:hypothetical protein
MRGIFWAILCSSLYLQVFAQPGALDLSFDPGIRADSSIYTAVVQADGKMTK